jgi:NTE family protein
MQSGLCRATRQRRRSVARAISRTLLFCLLVACGTATAQTVESTTFNDISCGARLAGDSRPRIGLALGGGGARGIAHISVLRKIEELRIPIDCVAGTSMGALVGGLYASGMSVDDMEELVVSTDWPRLFDDSLERPERSFRRKQDDRDSLTTIGVGIKNGSLKVSPGVLQGERILAMFERATLQVSAIDDFDRLPIPYRAVATDLNTGEAVVLDHGSLAMAMRASMSLPGIFQPVEVDGRVLLDGGLVNQVPVDVVRAMGADVVIAVDVGTPLAKLDRDASLLDVVSQISGMMTTGNTRRQLTTLESKDVLVLPELGDAVATGDFTKAREALAIGAKAAESARGELAVLSVTAERYAALREARPVLPDGAPVIEFVRFDNETAYADEVLLSYVQVPIGQPLDTAQVERGLLRAYSLGTLSSITYEVVHEDARTGVLLRARPKPQGPNYLQIGLTLNTDFEGAFESNLRAAVLFSPLSRLGAEGRVTLAIGSEPGLEGEYYHPLDVANRNLLYARAGYNNPNIHVFNADGDNFATYDVRILGVELKAAREFGNYGAVGVGVQRATGRARVEVGDPDLEEFDFEQGNLYANVIIDRLDSLFFPRNGYYATLGYTISRDWLGSDTEFDQVDFDTIGARSFGKHALQLGGSYHSTISGELPVQSRYRLGGRGRLAGFRLNELTGQHYALLYGGYTYQLAEFFGRSALVGGTIEYGNAWERREDMGFDDGILNASLYTGFDSWLGPMLFGFGWREGGTGVVFLEVGRPF